jgi:hypothetical protein
VSRSLVALSVLLLGLAVACRDRPQARPGALPAATAVRALSGASGTPAAAPGVGRYQHVFVLVEENHTYEQIIGNPAAPNLNRLAASYSLATSYYGVAHPSEPNYVALVGGSSYGIRDDAPFASHTIDQPSLADQIEQVGLSWKGYFQSLPAPGFTGICAPSGSDCLYASKHNGFLNFRHVQTNLAELQKLVPDTQLGQDLQSGRLPTFALIVPDLCHDMHGANCSSLSPGAGGRCDDSCLVAQADTYAGMLVDEITGAPFWQQGNNAIVIVWDEDDSGGNAGCCGASPGGGHVPLIVITSHAARALQDGTPANHFSLLQTVQQALGLGCLQHTCDTANVKPLVRLFAGR